MFDEATTTVAQRWNLSLPTSLREAIAALGPGEELGVWRLDLKDLDPSVSLGAGGPINLFPIGEDGMGGLLCLFPSLFDDTKAPAIAMWNPEDRQLTLLGDDFDDFLRKEPHRRLSFLLEHSGPVAEPLVQEARKGGTPSLDAVEEEKRIYTELLLDLCRTASKLGMSDEIFERAVGRGETPAFLRDVAGGDESAIDAAIAELANAAQAGDAAAALEVTAFHQIRQNHQEAVRFAYRLNKCLLFLWPEFSPTMLGRVTELIKLDAASIEAKDRLDPLFSFLTTQQVGKPDQRLNLANQYLRKKDFPAAAREALNALRLVPNPAADAQKPYERLAEIFQAAGRTREVEYVQVMLGKLKTPS